MGRLTIGTATFAMIMAVFAAAQDAPSRGGGFAKSFSNETLTYYNGPSRERLLLSLDELHLGPIGAGKAAPDRIRALAADAAVASLPNGELLLRFPAAANRAALDARATALSGNGYEVYAVVFSPSARERTTATRQVLTNRFSVKFKAGGDLQAAAARYDLGVVETVTFSPDTYIVRVNSGSITAALDAANFLYESGEAEFAAPLIERRQAARLVPNDPLFPDQWHLQNTGQSPGGIAGNDANIVDAWDTRTGDGINIAIVDTGVEVTHPDLSANARTDIDIDINGGDSDPTPEFSDHGTACAGIAAAAGNNGEGVVGAAFEAGIVAVRLIEDFTTDLDEANAFGHQVNPANPANRVHVSSNSWGPPDGFAGYSTMGSLTLASLQNGVTNGRGGLGTVYVFAAGNGREFGDNVNYDGYASSRFTIAVGASGAEGLFSYYSEPGMSMMVSAPSSYDFAGTTTTTVDAGYINDFGGTSSAAPLVSGIVALMLEENPGLGWRDVQHILVNTAVQIDPGDSGWQENGAGRFYNESYGFGRVDADAAVSSADLWINVPTSATPVTGSVSTPAAIPDDNPTGVTQTVSLSGAPANFFIEHLELTVDITHPFRGDLEVELTSPSGTISNLAYAHLDDGADLDNWLFTSVAHWGENPNGAWTLHVSDAFAADLGTLNNWSLTARGFVASPSLVVSPPSRYIPMDAEDYVFTVSNGGGGDFSWEAVVTNGTDWLSIATEAAKVEGNGRITATVDENTTGLVRAGTIQVTAPGTSGSPFNISVTQTPDGLPALSVPFFRRAR